jgi:hypothetical protein
MSDGTFSKDQVVALEKILGVKLPEQGFTLEIKPIVSGLDEGQLEGVVGGVAVPAPAQGMPSAQVPGPLTQTTNPLEIPPFRWSAKI